MNGDCWNEIGVFGDSSCPELKQYHHCTHCPKYAEGARRLLDQEPPADYVSEWTTVLAREKEIPRKNTVSALLFRVGEQWLALPAEVFREVVELRKVHSIPHRSNSILLGLVNIRGTLHLCVNLKALLNPSSEKWKVESEKVTDGRVQAGKQERVYSRMVVVERDSKSWAFAVDEILSLQRFSPEEIIPLPDSEKTSKGILEWDGRTFDVLDENLFFKRLEQSLE